MKFLDSTWLRVWLLLSSLWTFLISSAMLLVFLLPHAPWMITVPDWQEVAPKILSQLYKDMDWPEKLDKEKDYLLLISITNLVGSMGYDRSTFYTVILPYWTLALTITFIYSLFLAMTSLAMIYFLIFNYKFRLRIIAFTWIILNFVLLVLLTILWISLLVDMTSTNRMQLEQIQGTKDSYLVFIIVLMIIILFKYFSIIAGYFHIKNEMIEEEEDNKNYCLDELPSIEEGNVMSYSILADRQTWCQLFKCLDCLEASCHCQGLMHFGEMCVHPLVACCEFCSDSWCDFCSDSCCDFWSDFCSDSCCDFCGNSCCDSCCIFFCDFFCVFCCNFLAAIFG